MLPEKEKLNIVIKTFNALFKMTENTRLQHGAEEPFYQAARADEYAIVFSRNDFLSSALHEIAHWCIAGKERRKQDDFGYWYRPEGRILSEQLAFEQVEIKPQAIEWALSLACEHNFHFSADNLSQAIGASESFKISVKEQLINYLENDCLPDRAQQLFNQLNQFFRNGQSVEISNV